MSFALAPLCRVASVADVLSIAWRSIASSPSRLMRSVSVDTSSRGAVAPGEPIGMVPGQGFTVDTQTSGDR